LDKDMPSLFAPAVRTASPARNSGNFSSRHRNQASTAFRHCGKIKGMIDASFARQWIMHTPHAVVGMGGNVKVQPPQPAEQRPAQHETRLLRVGVLGGSETAWPAAARRVVEQLNGYPHIFAEGACAETAPADRAEGHDCLVLLGWPAANDCQRLKHIELYCRGGGPLVAIRTLDAELPCWPDFAEEVFGGRQVVRLQSPAERSRLLEVRRSDVAWHHPVLNGVENLIAEGVVYRGPRLSPQATVLLTADDGRGPAPVAWVMRRRPASGCPGRVFCTTLGHEDDFRDQAFLRLLSNAVSWAAQI
jgi:hypothetical protein